LGTGVGALIVIESLEPDEQEEDEEEDEEEDDDEEEDEEEEEEDDDEKNLADMGLLELLLLFDFLRSLMPSLELFFEEDSSLSFFEERFEESDSALSKVDVVAGCSGEGVEEDSVSRDLRTTIVS